MHLKKKFSIKNDIFLNFYIKNGNFLKEKSDPNIHQIAPFKKILGGHPTKPPSKAHGEAMRKFQNLKKISWPPLPNPGYAPDNRILNIDISNIEMRNDIKRFYINIIAITLTYNYVSSYLL